MRTLAIIVVGMLILTAILWRVALLVAPTFEEPELALWHKYDTAEKAALEAIVERFNVEQRGRVRVRLLQVAHDRFQDLLQTAHLGGGPDVFLFEHNPLGRLVAMNAVQPWPSDPTRAQRYWPGLMPALTVKGHEYGLPVAFKGLMVFRNTRLMPEPLRDTLDLGALQSRLPAGVAPLAYNVRDFFFHAVPFIAQGGQLMDAHMQRVTAFEGQGGESFGVVAELVRRGLVANATDYNDAVERFNRGQAALLINGPWFMGRIGLPANEWTVDPLPSFEGRKAGSLVTVEAAMVSAGSRYPELARELAEYLAGAPAQHIRLQTARLAPVRVMTATEVAALPRECQAQLEALRHGTVTPNVARMGLIWEPAKAVLDKVLRGIPLERALVDAKHAVALRDRPPPAEADPTPFAVVIGAVLLAAAVALCLWVSQPSHRQALVQSTTAYAFVLPGLLAVVVLTVAPLLVGAALGFFERPELGHEWRFVGVHNFERILAFDDYPLTHPRNFLFTLGVTVLWTTVNVMLHVAIGVGLALALNQPGLRGRGVYRALLILPWAIPSYLTALVWKGMFNAQFGAINAMLAALGILAPTQPFDWFARFSTAFAANVATNVWLGFPFMMVVTLGALQTVPRDLQDAARLDGASRWQTFWHVTWPHLRPALIPAVVLGSVWTFNMFNVIYLVSGGAPDGATDILVTEAYRWAFEGEMRQGYAAAYATVIFGVLLIYTTLTTRLMRPSAPSH